MQSPRIEKATTTFKKPKTDSVEDGSPSEPDAKPIVRSAPKVEIPEESIRRSSASSGNDAKTAQANIEPLVGRTRPPLRRDRKLSASDLNHSETNPDATHRHRRGSCPASKNSPIQNDACPDGRDSRFRIPIPNLGEGWKSVSPWPRQATKNLCSSSSLWLPSNVVSRKANR